MPATVPTARRRDDYLSGNRRLYLRGRFSWLSGTNLGAGPGVVGFAGGGAVDLVDDREHPRRLVARESIAAVNAQGVQGRRGGAVRDRDHGRDALAEALVGNADDNRVRHGRVRLQRRLDLFR